MSENSVKNTTDVLLAASAGFALGFVLGAAAVAIFDYRDARREYLKKIRKDSDENYYYSTD